MNIKKYPCVYMRGGTSKAVIFHRRDLPADEREWPELFLRVMGSPDLKQIDGMGGTVSSTSKIAVISPSRREGIDVDYHFFQIGVDKPVVDTRINCGNISAAVGPFAIDEGIVAAAEPMTRVRIFNINTQKVIEAHVQVSHGRAQEWGDAEIKGVPGTGSPIQLYFERPGGAATGKTFPTGRRKEDFDVPNFGTVSGTIMDCANPVVFVRAEQLGLGGDELSQLDGDKTALERLETIRGMAAQRLGFVEDWTQAAAKSAAGPKIVFFTKPKAYTAMDGTAVEADSMDLCCRAISMGKLHRAYPMTIAVATAAAARLEGTVVWETARLPERQEEVRLGHAGGTTSVDVKLDEKGEVLKAGVLRTARRIMDGHIYIRES